MNAVGAVTTETNSLVSVDAIRCPICGAERPKEFLKAPDRFHGRTELYTLVQCAVCSLVWLGNPPKPEDMGKHYGADYDRQISTTGETQDNRWTGHVQMLNKHKAGGRMLDLGCSSGAFLSSMPRDRWELFGVEMSEETALRARKRCGAEVFVGDVLDAPFPPEHFDAITCIHVYEHMYQPKEVMAKIAYWLKPGGIFYTMIPNIDSAAFRFFKSYWYALELPRHLFHFSPKTLNDAAASAGLKAVLLRTKREIFFEQSAQYVLDDAASAIGIRRRPLAEAKIPGIPFRIVRKAFRIAALPVIDALIGLGGDRELIEGMFQKPR
jgi:2-polyprenyl-3-methyl-5-hydroxy-6-metoxy-1,4-benzoquinol methylase